ncbi:FadR/GntR family transcriptional regulator [Amycolatopsis panacis]|uniref:FadR family transcriptional regulator n=1 Tax=Amycolatopsis panacis TaxID=2340917 RepID=A0A419I5P5_9PSEU|nr:FCD domain-containing protein [Amycolatopsis panacis]RJQ86258.1 FadR family transcriptional regulator [Amycolatopsis panacis]
MSSAVPRHPLATQAAEHLLARVRAGEWPLGHKLPGETTLAAQLGVGRSTLREAIRELAGKGVLDSRQGAGVFVTALDVPEEWDAVLRRASIVSVLEARIAIEAEAAALAAQRRTPADLRAVRRALAARLTSDEFVRADTEFHRAVLAAAHNDVLIELFDSFVPRIHRAMTELLRARPLVSPEEDQTAHRALADAIADRDPVAAAARSRAHLTAFKEAFS